MTLNSVIDIIHSTENKAIKEGMKSVNSNNKSCHVVCKFAATCRDDFRRACMEYSTFVYGRCSLNLFLIFHENI